MLGTWYAYAAASDPDKLPYDFSFWRIGASAVATGLGAWFTHRRSKAALPMACVAATATVGLGIINKARKGVYVTRTWGAHALREKLFNRAMPVAHAIGSAGLVGCALRSAALRRTTGAGTSVGPLIAASWYPLARKLGLYFMTFSMLGHWVEMLFCTGIKYGLFKGGYDRENRMLWDQWLFPFPAEGTAAVLADLVLVPVKNAIEGVLQLPAVSRFVPPALSTPLALAASFLVNQAVCTSVDFGTGMVANRNYELWDYRDMRFNFMGQVCLQNSLFYSTIATWGVWWLLPQLERLMARAGDVVLDGTLVGLGSFFVFLELLYQVLPPEGGAS